MEVLTFYICGNGFKYLISSIYRPPSSSSYQFNEMLINKLLLNYPENTKLIIVGDINLNLFNPLNLTCINNFINTLLGFNFFPVITLPSKINPGHVTTPYSLIDQIWSNFKEGRAHLSGVLDYSITDHLPIFYFFKHGNETESKYVCFRSMKEANVLNFVSRIVDSNFDFIYNIGDANICFKMFYDKIFHIYDICFPKRKKKVKSNLINAPWVTPVLKRCIKKKFKLYNLLKRGLIKRRDFNVYKRVLSFVTREMRRVYFLSKLHNEKDSKKLWSHINTFLNRKTQTKKTKILVPNGNEINGRDKVNYFNDFFVNIGNQIASNLPIDIDWSFFSRIPRVLNTFLFIPATDAEVSSIIGSIPNKGNSLYDVKPYILNKVTVILAPIISFLYNKCMFSGIYPDVLKLARVVPIFKSGSATHVNNYRPISILSSLNKIFEKMTCNRINSFLNKYNILSNCQFGFRPGLNTNVAIFTLVTDLLKTFNRSQYTVAVFLDLRKAFDTVNFNILLHKLSLYGFRGPINLFLKSYLSDRKQYVCMDDFNSDEKYIRIGVPQGSVLGPFFLIYLSTI